jgi:hypothetical protein
MIDCTVTEGGSRIYTVYDCNNIIVSNARLSTLLYSSIDAIGSVNSLSAVITERCELNVALVTGYSLLIPKSEYIDI